MENNKLSTQAYGNIRNVNSFFFQEAKRGSSYPDYYDRIIGKFSIQNDISIYISMRQSSKDPLVGRVATVTAKGASHKTSMRETTVTMMTILIIFNGDD